MSEVVRMALQNGESTIELLQQNHPGEFVSKCQPAQREQHSGALPGFVTESVCRANCEHQRRGTLILMFSNKLRQFARA